MHATPKRSIHTGPPAIARSSNCARQRITSQAESPHVCGGSGSLVYHKSCNFHTFAVGQQPDTPAMQRLCRSENCQEALLQIAQASSSRWARAYTQPTTHCVFFFFEYTHGSRMVNRVSAALGRTQKYAFSSVVNIIRTQHGSTA